MISGFEKNLIIGFIVVVTVFILGYILYKIRQKKEQDEATRCRDELKQKVVEGRVVEPQMGHAITPGVLPDWEKRRQQEQAFEEISRLLWRKENIGLDPDSEPAGIE